MSRRSWLPLAVVMLVMACSAVGWAASTDIVQMSDGTYWNIASHQQTDADGNALVADAAPDRAFAMLQPSILSTLFYHIKVGSGQPAGTALVDSMSAAILVRGYTHLGLMLYPSDTTIVKATALALQVRWSANSGVDSLSVYTEQPSIAPAAGTPDSLTTLAQVTMQYAATDSTAFPDEQVIIIPHKNGPRGMFVEIRRPGGNGSWPASGFYLSLRWRHLQTYVASMALAGNADAQAAGGEPWFRCRADLVGWR